MRFEDDKLSDVARLAPDPRWSFALDQVGLENVETVVLFNGKKLEARVEASVSLDDPNARGIHMSRLFKIISRLSSQEFSWEWLFSRVSEIKQSHADLSKTVMLKVAFQLPVLRPALLSQESGWRVYPVTFDVREVDGQREARLKLKVLYSSTCPCSTSLSQQALKDAFSNQFREEQLSRENILKWLSSNDSLVAVPHAQRSEANCELVFAPGQETHDPLNWINLIEESLGTPVQTAVKREDEQEFARLNAQNLMFCEDAARKIKAAFKKHGGLKDYFIEVRHFESLHPHDVVARVSSRTPEADGTK